MRLSMITDEVTQRFDEAVRFARALGLDGLELRSVEDMPIDSVPEKQLRAWSNMLDAEGLAVSNLASTFYKCSLRDDAARPTELEKLKRLCAAADILGCETIRGFTFFREEELAPDDMLEKIAEAYAKPVEVLKASQKTLMLEADPSVYTTSHAQVASVLQTLGIPKSAGLPHKLPCVAALYDPGNAVYDPDGEIPCPDGYLAVRGWLSHIHVKDVIKTVQGPQCVRVGEGLVDYMGLLSALKRDGYRGWLSMETHYRKGRRISGEAMRIPQGAAFSDGGMEAMAESIASLRAMMEAAG